MQNDIQYRFGPFKLGKLTGMRGLSFYLFAFHLALSGFLSYLQLIGVIPTLPFLTALFFGIPLLILLLIYTVRFTIQSKPIRYYWRSFLFLLCILSISFTLISNLTDYPIGSYVFSFNLAIVMWYIVAYIIGVNVDVPHINESKKTVLWLYFLMILLVFLNYDPVQSRITVNYNHLGIFLFLGDSFAIWSLLTISLYNKRFISVLLIFLSIVALYLISSRSSLYGFMVVLPLIFRKTKNGLIQITFITTAIIALCLFLINMDELVESRMLRFLFTGNDHSFYLRQVIMEQNFSDILNHWFFGDFAGQLRHGVFGYYIHNYLSLWRQFGLIPFAVFVALLFPAVRWFFQWYRGRRYQEYDFLFYLTLFLLIEIIFTRAYKSHFIWIVIGMITNVIRTEYLKKRSQKLVSTANEG